MEHVEEHLLAPPEERKLLDRPAEERLQEQVDAQRKQQEPKKPEDEEPKHPRRRTLWLLGLAAAIVLLIVFFVGYLPRHHRQSQIQAEAARERDELPVVYVTQVKRSMANTEMLLPGNITPLQEAYIYSRAGGFLRKRYVDIGDRVREGQLLAEVEAPELDQQVAQARAAVSQAEAQSRQSRADLEQARSNLDLATVTYNRYSVLVSHGVLSRQEGDQQQANLRTSQATTRAAEESLRASEDNVRAARANLERVVALQQFRFIRAPFSGVVTARNVDVGALISAAGAGQGAPTNSQPSSGGSGGSSGSGTSGGELFRIAQIGTLRILINVPQGNAPMIKTGQTADVLVQEFPKRKFVGRVTRTANAIDPSSRTLLTEVDVANSDGALLPGMYAQVQFRDTRANPPLVVPGDAVIARANGSSVAVLQDPTPAQKQQLQKEGQANDDPKLKQQSQNARRIHLERVDLGRDYGTDMEITGGLQGNEYVVVNPGDAVYEGALVMPATAPNPPKPQQPGGPSDRRPTGITSPGEAAVSQSNGPNSKAGGNGNAGNGPGGGGNSGGKAATNQNQRPQ